MKECEKCILNSNDDPDLNLDFNNKCNYCNFYDSQVKSIGSLLERTKILNKKILEIKKLGSNKKYDCIIGLSGGLDSSYMAYWLCKNGIRPLVIHLDNGWNSELAVQNIQNICEKLNLDLHTHVIDWDEFKDLQLAYLKSSVVDIEVLTDHAIKAIIFKMAKKYNIKYTFSGYNFATEAIMIKDWTFDKSDFRNIKDIAWKHGRIRKFKTFPTLSFWNKIYYRFFLDLQSIHLLNYIDYNTIEAKKTLEQELNWKDFGGKHYESIFTKFYQKYILPKKFNIDKRKLHFSNLICSGQLSREKALDLMNEPLYSDSNLLSEKEFFLKKINLTELEFANIMKYKIRSHNDFKTEEAYWKIYFTFVSKFKFLTKLFKN